jgi:hypothetical protein
MRPLVINTREQQTDTVRSLAIVLGIGLRAVTDGGYCAGDGQGAAVCEAGGEGLGLEEVGEDTGV